MTVELCSQQKIIAAGQTSASPASPPNAANGSGSRISFGGGTGAASSYELEPSASGLRPPVGIDTHCDTLLRVVDGSRHLDRIPEGHLDLPRLAAGGVDVQFFAAYVAPEFKFHQALRRTLQLIDAFWREAELFPDRIQVILTAEDVTGFPQPGRLGAVLAVEGAEAVEDLPLLHVLFRLGVRCLSLTWNQRNLLADGAGEAKANGGLTRLGEEVVREMNCLGMLVDVSHLAERSFWDVLGASSQPVIASHSNCRALHDSPRNLSDEQLKALAGEGGVVGITLAPSLLGSGEVGLATVLDHIAHAARVAGVDHVGIGSDYDGISSTPTGLEGADTRGKVKKALLERGYALAEVEKIMGGNLLRVMQSVLPGQGNSIG